MRKVEKVKPFGHSEAQKNIFFRTKFAHFSRPAETDPYMGQFLHIYVYVYTYMCTSVQVKTGAIARLCKCAQGNIGKNINGHRILLISAVQGPLAELLYLSLFVCLFVGCPAMVTLDQISTFFNIFWH